MTLGAGTCIGCLSTARHVFAAEDTHTHFSHQYLTINTTIPPLLSIPHNSEDSGLLSTHLSRQEVCRYAGIIDKTQTHTDINTSPRRPAECC